MSQYHPLSLVIIAVLMIAFGIAEIITGATRNFLGLISTADVPLATYAAAAIGSLYASGGLFVLTMKKWAARLAILSPIGVIAGRIFIVLAGRYPTASFLQTFSIAAGAAIAIFFALYIGSKWSSFQ